jgi:hypothetical protein
MNTPNGMHTDHINGNCLDNRRGNLRVCTQAENKRNLSLSKRNSSGFKGVYWSKERNKWHVRAGSKHIGRYNNIIDAAKAYNQAAISMFGEYAKLNDV